jgi:hypothetical protein
MPTLPAMYQVAWTKGRPDALSTIVPLNAGRR